MDCGEAGGRMTAAIATLLALALQLADPALLETGGPTLYVTIDAQPQPPWEPVASGPRWYRFEPRSGSAAEPRAFLYIERLTAIDLTYAVVHGEGIGPATWSAIVALSPGDFAPPAPDAIAALAVTTAVARSGSTDSSAVASNRDDAVTNPTGPAAITSGNRATGSSALDARDSATDHSVEGSEGFVYRSTTDSITVADPAAGVVLTLRYARRR